MLQDTVTLEFHAAREGSGPCMRGQAILWGVIKRLPDDGVSLNGLGRCGVPAGRSLEEVLGAVRALVERHDSLRTRFRETPAGLVQHVTGSGELTVAVHEVGPGSASDAGTHDGTAHDDEAHDDEAHDDEADGALDEAAETVGVALRDIAFDHALDLPLRVAVLTRLGRPAAVLIAVSHMAIDGWSGRIVRDDLDDLLAMREPPAAGQQPLERAAYERTPSARSRADRALEYWRQNYRGLPRSMVAAVGAADGPDQTWSMIESPALARAARVLSLRSGVEPGVVVLAATALLLAGCKGEQEAALTMIVSTRFLAATRRLVAPFNQNGLFRIDVADEAVDRFLTRAQEAQVRAFYNSEYDPDARDRAMAEIDAQRGITSRGLCYFNDVRLSRPVRDAAVEPRETSAASLAGMLSETRVSTPAERVFPTQSNFFLYLRELDTQAVLTLCVEEGFLPEGGPDAFLRDVEGLAVRAATQHDVSIRELHAEFPGERTGPAAARVR
jgi:Condensation domain